MCNKLSILTEKEQDELAELELKDCKDFIERLKRGDFED